MSPVKSLRTRTHVLVLSVATAKLVGTAAPASAVDVSGVGALGSGLGEAANTTAATVNSLVATLLDLALGR